MILRPAVLGRGLVLEELDRAGHLGIDDLEAEEHVPEQLADVGVRKTLQALEFDRLADVVDEHALEPHHVVLGLRRQFGDQSVWPSLT
ncbi:MAG: hypothetical protein K8S94_17340 [Planctomycetia bacterium]|nr:hypothetical protein [Planctomycetia bacterium]